MVDRLVQTIGAGCVPLPDVSTVHCGIAGRVEDAYRNLHLLETKPPQGITFYSTAVGRPYVPDRQSVSACRNLS